MLSKLSELDSRELPIRWSYFGINGESGLPSVSTTPFRRHAAVTQVEDGLLRLITYPDSQCDFARVPHYINAYVLSEELLAPRSDEILSVHWSMGIEGLIDGTTGLWIQDINTFDDQGYFVQGDKKGFFNGAYGYSVTGEFSHRWHRGPRFAYVRGWLPAALHTYQRVMTNPSKWHDYEIRWENTGEADRFTLFIDGNASNHFEYNKPFSRPQLHLWKDNYKIGPFFNIDFGNPVQPVSTVYKDMHIFMHHK